MKIGFISLGCSKNTIDTEMMLTHLDDAGWEITGDAREADVILINTCGFIGDAKEESIETIREIAGLKKNRKIKKADRYRLSGRTLARKNPAKTA